MTVEFRPLVPWTMSTRMAVLSVAAEMDPMDAKEVYGLRPVSDAPDDLTHDIAGLISGFRMLDGFVAWRRVGDVMLPVAVAFAFRSTMPRVAELALFGRRGHARAMPAVWAELIRRKPLLIEKNGIRLAQVAVLAEHRAALRMIAKSGAVPAFNYGPVGSHGGDYIHMIWRFPNGVSGTEV